MPDSSSIFPSLNLELQQLHANNLQDTPVIPDYGIQRGLQNLDSLYSQLSTIKGQSPMVKSQGAMRTPGSFMFPSIKQALSPVPRSSDVGPAIYDPAIEQPERYANSPKAADIGFIPGRDNEDLYGREQGKWDSLKNAVTGAWGLAKFQFVDQLKGWGRMVDGIFSADLSKLYGTDGMDHVNNEMQRIMNENPVYQSQKDRSSVFTFGNFANTVQQSGFTIGAISEIAAEEVLLSALTAGTGGGAAELQGVRTASLMGSIGRAFRRVEPVADAVLDGKSMRSVFSKLTEYSPLQNTLGVALGGMRAGESTASLLARGFGGFYRDMREANAAFTEARAETSGTYAQLKQSLLQDLQNSNQEVTPEKLDSIEKTARSAADANFWTNAAVISVSNRIEFNNIFRGFKGASRYLAEAGEIGENAGGYFKRETIPFRKGFLKTFRSEILKKPISYFSNNLTEALQENVQNISNNAIQAYYKANYYNPGTLSMVQAVKDATKQEANTPSGAQTFLAGFLTAAITNPLTHGVPALYERIGTSKGERQQRESHLQDTLNSLNGFFTGPEGRNAGIHASLGSAMGEAIKQGDQKKFQDLKDESVRQFVRTGIETGKLDSMFHRLSSIAGAMSKDEFEKAFGIEFTEGNRASARDYISQLQQRADKVKDIKDDLDFRYPNPFLKAQPTTEQEKRDAVRSYNGYEEAKWHLAFMEDAHKRTFERQTDLLRDIQHSMKDVDYSSIYTLTDLQRAKQEVKLLRSEADLSGDARLSSQKNRKADLLESMIPSLEKGELPLKTFTSYVNHVQSSGDRPMIESSVIRDNHKKINDFLQLSRDQQKLSDNVNWLADPENFSKFAQRHQDFEHMEEVLKGVTEDLDTKDFQVIRDEHPDYDIKVDKENQNVEITPKEGKLGSDEELNTIKGKIQTAVQKVTNPPAPDADKEIFNKRISDIHQKAVSTGKISDQDRQFLDLDKTKETGKDNPDLIELQRLAQTLPTETQDKTPGPEPTADKTEDTPTTEDDPDAFPYYEGSERTQVNQNKKELLAQAGAIATISQEVKDKGNDRTAAGDVKSEGSYSLVRGTIARLFANSPNLFNGYEFVLLPDNPAFYEHANGFSEETKKQLGVFDVVQSGSRKTTSPYHYFLVQKGRGGSPVLAIKKRGGGDFAYFNPHVPGILTDSKHGAIGVFAIDYLNSGFTQSDLSGFLATQKNQQYFLDTSTISVSPGAYFETGKLRDLTEFTKGVTTPYELHIAKGLKDVDWVTHPEDARNGGAFIRMGQLNKIKLLPAHLSDIQVEGKNYDLRSVFNHSFRSEAEAATAAAELSKIIYSNIYRPQNQLPERVTVGTQRTQDGYKLSLSLLNPTPETANFPDSRAMQWRDSKQPTDTVLNYLLENRRMNVLASFHQDISIPVVEGGNLRYAKMNYEQFMNSNLLTNKSRVEQPDGSYDIQPVNQYFIFPGLAAEIKTPEPVQQKADKAAGALTGETPKKQEEEDPITKLFGPAGVQEQKGEDAAKFVQEMISEGVLKGGYVEMAKLDPMGFLKFVAQQANNLNESGQVNTNSDSRPSAEESFGKTLIEVANEQFPEYQRISENTEKLTAEDLLKKRQQGSTKRLADEDFGDALTKLKDGTERAVIGNEELQFIKDRFGDHVLNHLAYAANSNYWGYWKNATITLYSDTQAGVGYHESWHHFSQTFLTPKEKFSLYSEVQRVNPSLTSLKGIEEHLANEFQKYAQSDGKVAPVAKVKRNIFQKIWDFLKRLFSKPGLQDKYFADLYQGKLYNYTPSINNALWGRLNYGFTVNEAGRTFELFNPEEYVKAKGLFHSMLFRAFASDDPAYSLKARNISMATLLGLRGSKALRDKALQNVYLAVDNQINNFISENSSSLGPAGLSILNRLSSFQSEFFNHVMEQFQIASNVEDTPIQEDPTVESPSDIPEASGEPVEQPENITDEDPAIQEGQFSDKVVEFQDKGLLAMLSKPMRNFILTIPRAQVTYDSNGRIHSVSEYKNEYGFPEPCDFYKVVNVLGEEFQGIFEDHKILDKINSEDMLQRLPEIQFIRQSLPSFDEVKDYPTQLMISVFRDFNRVYTPVYSHIEDVSEEGIDIWKEQSKGTIDTIRREWQSGFANSESTIVDSTGTRYLKPSFVRDLAGVYTTEKKMAFLKGLGISFSDRTTHTREFTDLLRSTGMDRFVSSVEARLAAGQKIERLGNIASSFSYTDAEGKPQRIEGESSFINDLLRVESLYSERIPSNMYRTAKGTNKYALMLPNQFNIVGSALKAANTIGDLGAKHLSYLVDPRNYSIKGSLLLRSLFDDKGVKRERFIFGDYNSAVLKVFDKKIEKQTVELTGREKLMVNLKTFFGSGAIDIMRTGTSESSYFWQLPSYSHRYELGTGEKVTLPDVKLMPFNPRTLYTAGKPNANFFRAFNGYFFNLAVSELGVMKSLGSSWGIFDKIFSGELKAALLKSVKDIDPSEIRDRIRPHMDDIVSETMEYFKGDNKRSLTGRFIKYAERFGITNDDVGRPPEILGKKLRSYGLTWRETAFVFVLNNFAMNAETLRMLGATPQIFKEFMKRFKGTISPGNNMNFGRIVAGKLQKSHPLTMAAALGKSFNENIDEVRSVVHSDDYADLEPDVKERFSKLGKLLGREAEMGEYLEAYNKKNPVNDGQAKMTLDFYRRFRMQTGNWNLDTDEKEYIKEVAGWRLRKGLYKSEEEKKSLEATLQKFSDKTYSNFGVAKLHYHGPIKKTGVPLLAQHKYAVAPLVPSAIEGTPEDDLNDWLLDKGFDYSTAKSGSKIYTPEPSQYWTDADARTTFNKEAASEPVTLLAPYLKEQIKIDGSFKKESTWSIQLRSLFLSNMFNNGEADAKVQNLFNNYQKTLHDLVTAEKGELYHEFGISESPDGSIRVANAKDFVRTLQKQIELRKLNSNIKRAIGYDDVSGGFTTPLEIVSNRQQVVDLINGMIYRRLVRVKLNGDNLVQISSTGTTKSGEKELQFYRPKFDKSGKYTGFFPAEAKVAINKNFYPLFQLTHPDGKRIAVVKNKTLDTESSRKRLNEAIADEKWAKEHAPELEVIGTRIPLQEMSSIEHQTIREFLPENFGNGMIVSREMTTKAGSDFDNDKLHIIRPNYNRTTGKLIGEESVPVYRKALERLQKLQQRDESLSSLIQEIFDTGSDEREDEREMQVDITPMSDEDRNIINTYLEAKRDLKGHYANKILTSYKEALQNSPEAFMQLIRPNTDSQVKKLAIEMAERAGMPGFTKEGVQTFRNTEILEYPSSHITFEQNKLSKTHLAVFAVLNRIIQNYMLTGAKINPQFKHKYYIFKSGDSIAKRMVYNTTMWLLSPKERASFTRDGKYLIGSSRDADQALKQFIVSQLMNATVDIEKNPFYAGLGINEYNVGVAAILIALNVPIERVTAFLQQPILQEYYRRQAENPYFKEDFMPTAVRATNRNAVLMYGLKNKRGGAAGTEALEFAIRDRQNADDKDYEKIFSLENLLKNVGRTEWKNKEQEIIFAHFLFLSRLQRPYMRAQQLITIDNKKISSPIGAESFDNMTSDLRESDMYPSETIDALQQRSYTAPFKMNNEIRQVFAAMMPLGFSQKFVQAVSARIKRADLFMNKADTLKLERTVANDYMLYIILQNGEYKGENLREYVARELSRKINPQRIAARLSGMQKEFPEVFRFFSLAGKLHPSTSSRIVNLENVELRRGLDSSTEVQDAYISEFEKLVNFKGREIPGYTYTPQQVEKIRSFFKDLAVVAFGQSGFNKSALYMTDILPLSEIDPITRKALQSYEGQIKKDPTFEDKFIQGFLDDFSRENPTFGMQPSFPANPDPNRGKYLNRPFKEKTEVPKPEKPKPEFIQTNANITREHIQNTPYILYLFGDNMQREGMKGQAEQFRGEPNVIGIATKKAPRGDTSAFFSDTKAEEYKKVITEDINRAIAAWDSGKYTKLVVPPLGTGFAKLDTKAPQVFAHLQSEIQRLKAHVMGSEQEQEEPSQPDEPSKAEIDSVIEEKDKGC